MLGLWRTNGAALAFAEAISRRFVRGPRSAKLAAWGLGVLFFQGGAFSAVLVGGVIKPLADRHRVSHEELSYVIDATSSPISLLIPLNAWPFYVQGLLAVSGVAFLTTAYDRILFYVQSVPLFFFAMLSVTFTFLLAIDRLPFMGQRFRRAVTRARDTGKLDSAHAQPLSTPILSHSAIARGYEPRPSEFYLGIAGIIVMFVVAFRFLGPAWAFLTMGLGLVPAMLVSVKRGLAWNVLGRGLAYGTASVLPICLLLVAAVMLGSLSGELGAGHFVSRQLSGAIHPLFLPATLFLLSGVLAFGTGSSWGTFALVLPFSMPLAWAVAIVTEVAHPQFLLMLCLAASVNGSVFGDQCSPLSDTTILSSAASGCDVMDHVRTQWIPSAFAAAFAMVLWTLLAIIATWGF
nr:Na+/H+ antiporter NhaC family protein [Natronocella acetinitrilica]